MNRVIVFAAFLMLALPVMATTPAPTPPATGRQPVATATAAATSNPYQSQNQIQSSHSDSDAVSSANNTGNNLSSNEYDERQAPSPVLVPNNNTENCLRVFGFGGSTVNGSVVFGVPWRSKECDLEAAADDAFAQGNLRLGWTFKCKMKSMRSVFASEDECLATATAGERAAIAALKQQVADLNSQNAYLKAKEFTAAEADERCKRQEKACASK